MHIVIWRNQFLGRGWWVVLSKGRSPSLSVTSLKLLVRNKDSVCFPGGNPNIWNWRQSKSDKTHWKLHVGLVLFLIFLKTQSRFSFPWIKGRIWDTVIVCDRLYQWWSYLSQDIFTLKYLVLMLITVIQL